MNSLTKATILNDDFYGGKHRGNTIAGFEEFVLPVIDKILESSRHLSATGLARVANRYSPGHDYRGCNKSHCAARLAAVRCRGSRELGFTGTASPEVVESLCRELRFSTNGWNRQDNTPGAAAPIEADREYLIGELARIDAALAVAQPGDVDPRTRGNLIANLKSQRYRCQTLLDALGVPSSVVLDSLDKVHAAIDALEHYAAYGAGTEARRLVAAGLAYEIRKNLRVR